MRFLCLGEETYGESSAVEGDLKSASVANRHEEATCAWLDDNCITAVSFLSLVLLCSF